MCTIVTFQRNLSTIFLNLLNIHLFSKIFQKVKIVMQRWNTLQYLTKILRQYFNCNEILEIFLICFCNILSMWVTIVLWMKRIAIKYEYNNIFVKRNILQYLTKILRQYFNCNEILEIFLTCFCNILSMWVTIVLWMKWIEIKYEYNNFFVKRNILQYLTKILRQYVNCN